MLYTFQKCRDDPTIPLFNLRSVNIDRVFKTPQSLVHLSCCFCVETSSMALEEDTLEVLGEQKIELQLGEHTRKED
jgi:hypothetical protein